MNTIHTVDAWYEVYREAACPIVAAKRLPDVEKGYSKGLGGARGAGFSWWGVGLSKTAATHKATKTALTQLTAALRQELHEAGARSPFPTRPSCIIRTTPLRHPA